MSYVNVLLGRYYDNSGELSGYLFTYTKYNIKNNWKSQNTSPTQGNLIYLSLFSRWLIIVLMRATILVKFELTQHIQWNVCHVHNKITHKRNELET